MCPLRFILVFFSAILAGYFAWRAVSASPEPDFAVSDDSSTPKKMSSQENQQLSFVKMVQNCFWVFVDMASGKYLWRNFKEMQQAEKIKSS